MSKQKSHDLHPLPAVIWQCVMSVSLLFIASMCASQSALALSGENDVKQYVHKTWNSSNGLPEDDVRAIAQTKDGYLWLGTEEGLVRFDGVQFTVFDHRNTPSMTSNLITALTETPDGTLWVGTSTGLLRSKNSRFFVRIEQQELDNVYVYSLWAAPDGTLWILASDGVILWKDGRFARIALSIHGATLDPGPKVGGDKEGNRWIATDSGLVFWKDGAQRLYTTDEGLFSNSVGTVYEDREGTVWIGTDRGLDRIVSGHISPYSLGGKNPFPKIKSVLEDRDGNLWIATAGSGLFRVNRQGISMYGSVNGSQSARPTEAYDQLHQLFEDREGNLWVSTLGAGVEEFRDGAITPYGGPEGLTDEVVGSVMQSRDGSIWMCSQGGDLSGLKDGKISVYKTTSGVSVRSVFETKDGSVWRGLNRLKNGALLPALRGLEDVRPRSMYQDSDGVLWVGADTGLIRVQIGTQSHTAYTSADGLASNKVSSIVGSRAGGMWVGTHGGLSYFKDGHFKSYTTRDGLSSNVIFALYEDADGTLWIGTTAALDRFRDGKFTTYSDRDGLFDSPIWSILEDDSGYLWMSSDKGIFRVKKTDLDDFAARKSNSFRSISYGTEDGMRNSECDGAIQPAGWKDRDGNLWFPTPAGVVRVEPALAAKKREAPRTLIEEILIDDKPVDPVLGGRLPPGGRQLEFHYTAPTFTASKGIHFRYRLKGFDSEWIDAGTRRIAYYTNLRPGAYQFEVTASSADGTWAGNKALVNFYLTPHFYQTYWFYLCCFLSACGLVFILHNLRTRTLKARERFLNQQVGERTVRLEQEITERKRAEESAELARGAAETANRAKSDFLACMSHEIRTPMNGIIGMTELVLDSELTLDQRESLGLVRLSAESLLSIINDILDFSKIEAGKMDLEAIPFDLRESLGETMKALGIRAHQKGLELIYEVQSDVPEPLVGDPGRIRQILINLVGNSVKFTEKGEVFVGVFEESREPGASHLHFTVRDTGVGIPPDKREKIFEAFSQADGSTARKYGGTGLGLTICVRIVTMMGGKIWVESKSGEGSTFHFTVRLGVQDSSSARSLPVKPEQLNDLRVLIVDDNFTNRRVLSGMLARGGMQPTAVEGGRPALQALEIAKSTGHRFPLILLDGHMPEMDGFTLAENIKKDPELVGATIMMLTSAGQLGDAARCRELGISAYLVKPIRQGELLETICNILNPIPQKRDVLVTRHTLREERKRLKVLVAEDNAVNRTLAVRLLEKRGYITSVATNGREALAALEREAFDLVLMDVQMPEMDGFEATAAIRHKEQSTGEHIPIVAMTAHSLKGDEEKCLGAGMDAYISKPIRTNELFTTIESMFDKQSLERWNLPGHAVPQL